MDLLLLTACFQFATQIRRKPFCQGTGWPRELVIGNESCSLSGLNGAPLIVNYLILLETFATWAKPLDSFPSLKQELKLSDRRWEGELGEQPAWGWKWTKRERTWGFCSEAWGFPPGCPRRGGLGWVSQERSSLREVEWRHISQSGRVKNSNRGIFISSDQLPWSRGSKHSCSNSQGERDFAIYCLLSKPSLSLKNRRSWSSELYELTQTMNLLFWALPQ